MPGRPMTEEQKRNKRERERERQNSIPVSLNSSNLAEKVTPQIPFLNTKPFVIQLGMSYFKWMHKLFLKSCF